MLRKPISVFFLLMVGFVMLPVGAGAQMTGSTLYEFAGPDGTGPNPSLVQGFDGNYYGVTINGGANDNFGPNSPGGGTVFKISSSGTFSLLYSFCSQAECADGESLYGGIVQGPDGNIYGTTDYGGAYGHGGIFKLTPSGTITVLHSFCSQTNCTDGWENGSPMILAADGNFYGTTVLGGSGTYCPGEAFVDGCGTIFKMTPSGVFTVLYSFCSLQSCADGIAPNASLVQGKDGNFYGTTPEGGDGEYCTNSFWYNGTCGTIFRITSSGTLTTIYNFCSQVNCSDGATPFTSLTEGIDGSLYGNTPQAIFNLSSSGTLTTIYSSTTRQSLGAPFLASDGNFYGSTSPYGGFSQGGSVFSLSYAGIYNTLYESNSAIPTQIMQGSDGNFYGTSEYGGNVVSGDCGSPGCGTIQKFSASPALAAPVQVALSKSTVGLNDSVTLDWQVLNAFSLTMQQCYAFVRNDAAGAGNWTGLQTGSMVNGIYQGTATISPTVAGLYSYALTCGGVESGVSGYLAAGGFKVATATSLQAPSSVTIGSLVTLTATPATQQDVGAITGTVAFSYGSLPLGTVNLFNGAASLNVSAQGIPTGTYPITASYSGDSNYQPSVGTANVTVLGYATGTNLTASTAQVTQGQAVTLLAAVARSSVSGTPSGNVTFSYGSTVLGTAKLVNGTASFTAATNGSIPPGTYGVTAKYDGDATDQTSVSAPLNVTVIAATSTSLSVSPTTVPKNSAVMLTSVVKRKYDAGVPTGSVTFSVGSYFLGTQALDGTGMAVVNASSVGIAAGTYPVTATYSGDASNAASSGTVDVTVE